MTGQNKINVNIKSFEGCKAFSPPPPKKKYKVFCGGEIKKN